MVIVIYGHICSHSNVVMVDSSDCKYFNFIEDSIYRLIQKYRLRASLPISSYNLLFNRLGPPTNSFIEFETVAA